MKEPFKLTAMDLNEPGMRRLMAHYEERLRVKRELNDKVAPQDKTDFLRGEISQIKEFLALAKKDGATG